MKMRIDFLKIVLFSCIFYESALVVLSYRATINQDHINNRQRQYWMRRNQISETTTIKPPLTVHHSNDFVLGGNKVRHQSRFAKFDTVKRMIDHRVVTTSPKPQTNNRDHRTIGWNYNYKAITSSDKEIFDSDFYVFGNDDYYEDDDAEGDAMEDDFYVDEEEEEDDDDLNDSENYLFSDWQAEETTTVKVKSVQSPYHSSFTDLKWTHLGTKERVEATRAQIMQQKNLTEESGVKAFLQHFVRVKQEAQCRKPLPKVISVQSEHPDPSKTYTPQCTVLHRCAEDTGCCKHNTKCQYKSRHLVHLYFYTRTIGSSATSVEKLSFYNHSECECQQQNNTNVINLNPSSNTYSGLPAQYTQKCKCPEVFVPKIRYEDYSCSCDCEENNEDCLRMKKGKEHFGLTDRKCIGNRSCGLPICEYGSYLNQIGRCPKKLEKLEDFRRFKIRSVE